MGGGSEGICKFLLKRFRETRSGGYTDSEGGIHAPSERNLHSRVQSDAQKPPLLQSSMKVGWQESMNFHLGMKANVVLVFHRDVFR